MAYIIMDAHAIPLKLTTVFSILGRFKNLVYTFLHGIKKINSTIQNYNTHSSTTLQSVISFIILPVHGHHPTQDFASYGHKNLLILAKKAGKNVTLKYL